MKGKIFLFLFALPFAGVGVWMAYSIGATVHDAWQMRGWVPVEASVTRVNGSAAPSEVMKRQHPKAMIPAIVETLYRWPAGHSTRRSLEYMRKPLWLQRRC